jgi:hypothetical protein
VICLSALVTLWDLINIVPEGADVIDKIYSIFHIKRAESPDCPHCPGINKDVKHFLFMCPNYKEPRAKLREKAGRKAYSIWFLASNQGSWC